MSQVVTLPSATGEPAIELGAAIREFLETGDFQASTRAVYERTLEALLEDLGADSRWSASTGRSPTRRPPVRRSC
jgi:hypothetical protein